MKKFLLGLGLVIVLAGCSSNPVPNPVPNVNSPAPILTVAVPNMCQVLTAAKATEITGVDQMVAVDGETGNSFSPDGVLWNSMCGWSTLASNPTSGGASTVCDSGATDEMAMFQKMEQQAQNSELWSQPAADVTVKPVTGLGSQAFLATGISGVPKYEADVSFVDEGHDVMCNFLSGSDIRTGDEQGASLVAFAKQVAQAIQP
jgi:hypothetical protein